MKRAVLITAMFLGAGAAVAAPAPVEDIAGGSGDDRLARIERIVKSRQQSELDMQRRLDTLQQEVLDLRGLTEQQNYQIEQHLGGASYLYLRGMNGQAQQGYMYWKPDDEFILRLGAILGYFSEDKMGKPM